MTALSLSKIFYWIVNRFRGNLFFYIILFFSFIVGFFLCYVPFEYEYWYFIHVLLLTPFMAFGDILKNCSVRLKYKKNFSILLYMVILAVTILLFRLGVFQKDSYFDVPAITLSFININFTTFIPLILLIVFGYFATMQLSERINTNRFLEYIGKNSLVIYCVHNIILYRSICFIYKWGGQDSYWLIFIFLISSFLLTIIASCFISWFFSF